MRAIARSIGDVVSHLEVTYVKYGIDLQIANTVTRNIPDIIQAIVFPRAAVARTDADTMEVLRSSLLRTNCLLRLVCLLRLCFLRCLRSGTSSVDS